jgi:hypothetical protein
MTSRSVFLRIWSVPGKSFVLSNFFFRKSCHLLDNVEKCGGDKGHKWRHNMAHTICMLISKATCTLAHTDKYVILIAFPRQKWFANAPQCYVIRTLSLLLFWGGILCTFSSLARPELVIPPLHSARPLQCLLKRLLLNSVATTPSFSPVLCPQNKIK